MKRSAIAAVTKATKPIPVAITTIAMAAAAKIAPLPMMITAAISATHRTPSGLE
jgi:hypothetical protein